MDLYKSEKNFLEKVADAIPGLSGYRQKEAARDTDKRLREYMARQIDQLRRKVEDFKGTLLNQGRLDLVDDVDLLARKMSRIADSFRYASYGYGGLFDQVKFREQELSMLYEFDTRIVDEVHRMASVVQAFNPTADPQAQLSGLNEILNSLSDLYQQRTQLLNRPPAE